MINKDLVSDGYLGCKPIGRASANDNLNDLEVGTTIFWNAGSGQTPINAPAGGGRCYCFYGYGIAHIIQIVFIYNSPNIYFRYKWGDNWSSWRAI